MVQKINTLEIVNLDGGFETNLFDYGNIREGLSPFYNFTFHTGIYVVECDCFDGGWALSILLTGRDDVDRGDILVNNDKVSSESLRKTYSCMVGDESELRRFGFMHMTIKEQIKYGVRRRRSYGNSYDQIVEKFSLSDSVLNRRIVNVGTERWRASMAIGYANGKIIYCLPWMNAQGFKSINCWSECLPLLVSSGAIVIIPTTTHDCVKDILRDYKSIKLKDIHKYPDVY